MRIAVTGARGLLGPFLVEAFQELGEVIPLSRSEADLADREQVDALLKGTAPDALVHAAAYTDVDGCERDPDRAQRDNVESTSNLAELLPATALLVFLSTDQVYPDTVGPHVESPTGPVNVYGATKLAAEAAVSDRARGLVLRCNFFAESRTPARSSLSDVIVRTLAAGQTFTGFTDSCFSPLHASTLADEVASSIASGLDGTYNIGSSTGVSKAAFARLVAHQLSFDEALVRDTESSALAGRARRPHDLRMDSRLYTATTGRSLPTLEHEVTLL